MTELEKLLEEAGLTKTQLSKLYPCHPDRVRVWNHGLPVKVKRWLNMYIELTPEQRKELFGEA